MKYNEVNWAKAWRGLAVTLDGAGLSVCPLMTQSGHRRSISEVIDATNSKKGPSPRLGRALVHL